MSSLNELQTKRKRMKWEDSVACIKYEDYFKGHGENSTLKSKTSRNDTFATQPRPLVKW